MVKKRRNKVQKKVPVDKKKEPLMIEVWNWYKVVLK